ncbi:MAG: DUF3450 domain-containing protein [Lentisphaerae bacterium]|nr:DUF3450 domain-containing protein [Lentisphaerota bacterium]
MPSPSLYTRPVFFWVLVRGAALSRHSALLSSSHTSCFAAAAAPACAFLLAIAPAITAHTAGADAAEARDLEALAGKWIDLRTAVAEEQRAWAARKDAILRETNLLEAEKRSVIAETAELRESADSAALHFAAAREKYAALAAAAGKIKSELDRAEARLTDWHRRMPEPLRDTVAPLFAELADEEKSLSEQARVVLAIYLEMDRFRSRPQAAVEMIADGDTRRRADVLYLGMALAFAVSRDGQWAAVGKPGAAGWTWEARPDLARRIRRGIEIARGESPPSLVGLQLSTGMADPDKENAP